MHPKQTSGDYITDNRSGIHAPFDDLSLFHSTTSYSSISGMISDFISKQQLIRLSVIRGRGESFSIPCRILNYDQDTELITVYHVDQKQVYTFKMNEIEDLVAFD